MHEARSDSVATYEMTETFCLNDAFSTTRRVIRKSRPRLYGPSPECENRIVLPPNPRRKGEGGLRLSGYLKVPAFASTEGVVLEDTSKFHPLVTIITVTRNCAKTLEESMISVINRRYDNIEYIVVDGGSTDGSIEIIRKYEYAIDYWISEPDAGIYDAMNKALDLALGDRIYFLGGDDILVTNLEAFVPLFKNRRVIYYGDVYMAHRRILYDGAFNDFKLVVRNICQQAIFYPNAVFRKYRFSTRYAMLADYHLNARCNSDSYFSFEYVPELVAIYNDLTGMSSTNSDTEMRNDRTRLAKELFSTKAYYYFIMRRALLGILNVLGTKTALKTLKRRSQARPRK